MFKNLARLGLSLCVAISAASHAKAMEMQMMPSRHSPIGIMGDHLAMKDKWMISVRLSRMAMKGNRLNGDSILDQDVLQQPNPYASVPNMPMELSVVPQDMTMDMLMVGAMYAPSDALTLMGMVMFNTKEMSLATYNGMMGRSYLGSFDTSSSDLSQASLTALYKLYKTPKHRAHLHLGFTQGVGKNNVMDKVLTPMNMQAVMTLPYGMQSSDRSQRLTVGITNVSTLGDYRLGNQLLFDTALAKKSWTYGDQWNVNSWVQRDFGHDLSFSARLHYKSQQSINGRDVSIMAPVQTANPDNYGGQVVDFAVGMSVASNMFGGNHEKIGMELVLPVKQNKRGLQMENDWTFILGFKTGF